MKKRLAAAITTALVVGVASTTFAAANPFVDVPAKHWSYDAVTKLAQAGIVDGYGDATYRGDRTITRYEMAQIVAKAMTKSDKADAEQKAALDKLAVEYAAELNNLGVRVAKLEANQSNIKFTGEVRFRYEDSDVKYSGTKVQDKDKFELRTRIHMTGAINDEWSYGGRFEATQNLRESGDNGDVTLNNAYITGPIAGTQFTAGRFDYMPAYGTVIDSTLDGVKVEFGNRLKATLYYGKEDNKTGLYVNNVLQEVDDTNYYGAELKYKASRATNLVAAYHHLDTAKIDSGDAREIWEVGFDAGIAKNVKLIGNYVDSNADHNDTAWLAGLQFKEANYKNKGSFDVFANYRNVEVNSVWDPTVDGELLVNGSKGYELGFHYVPMKNSLMEVKYIDVKDVDDSKLKNKFFRAQVEFFF